ncbi:MAG: aspartate carbamoyltransferase regulatory subunit [Clostridiales bacterium]|nr:aspartate carbamoyltransferase regulatory subunit [Clostridiales bacterium]
MLSIDSLTNGIVIDHIRAGMGHKIFEVLGLDKMGCTVALIMNVQSKKRGKKDIIKIENVFDIDLTEIGIIDDGVTINIIRDEKIQEKKYIQLPEVVVGLLKCSNPRCVTSSERGVVSSFTLVDRELKQYKCDYCDHFYEMED